MWKSFVQMLDRLRADIDRYVIMDSSHWLIALFNNRGLWALTQYRFSYWVHHEFHVPGLRSVLKIFNAIWRKLIEITTGIEIPNRTEIGKGLYINHAFGIFIHNGVKIGEYCNLSQDVSIGIAGRGDKQGVPQLGNRVFVGPGARIIGPVKVGNDVAIGANAVVTKDLPDYAVAVGIPAKIISYKGSKDFIFYREANNEASQKLLDPESFDET